MKTLFMSITVLAFLSGCFADKTYDLAKPIYISERALIIEHWDEIPPEYQEKLKMIDDSLKAYDGIRPFIKEIIKK